MNVAVVPLTQPVLCRNRATQLADALIGDEGERIVKKVIARALIGDPTCLRLCLERLSPPVKERQVELELPALTGPNAAVLAAAILEAVAAGQVTPSEGIALASLVESYRKTVETNELERRVAALETQQGGKHG